MCDIVVILADGRLALQGVGLDKNVPGVGGKQEQYEVVGGSGAYTGATGVMTRKGNRNKDTITFTLE
jgi:hypothetical protein